MRSLRQFAQFVGKPQSPTSPRALVDYLRLNMDPKALSLRGLIEGFENMPSPVALDSMSVEPSSAVVPFQVTMRITRTRGYVFGVRWRIMRQEKIIASYDLLKTGPGLPPAVHTLTEPGTYTVLGAVFGIGKDGYAEAAAHVTIKAEPQPQPQPQPQSKTLTLFLGPSELIPNTLRITSINWKVTPVWNPSQVFTASGSGAQVPFPQPPAGEQRMMVEPSFRCEVAGVVNGVEFPHSEFDGIVDPSPIFVGWEGRSLKAGWLPVWDTVHVGNNIFKVVVVAKLQNIE